MDEWQKITGESRSNTFPVEKLLQEIAFIKKAADTYPLLQLVLGDD
jgi:hypothetical protein